mmetsp:Transcript_109646/g.153577  ORF Transcript_109646/g.153577 Transcript_109646/m.153577 type:complete len:221 (+) Transcript_109646:936-1598(+)
MRCPLMTCPLPPPSPASALWLPRVLVAPSDPPAAPVKMVKMVLKDPPDPPDLKVRLVSVVTAVRVDPRAPVAPLVPPAPMAKAKPEPKDPVAPRARLAPPDPTERMAPMDTVVPVAPLVMPDPPAPLALVVTMETATNAPTTRCPGRSLAPPVPCALSLLLARPSRTKPSAVAAGCSPLTLNRPSTPLSTKPTSRTGSSSKTLPEPTATCARCPTPAPST